MKLEDAIKIVRTKGYLVIPREEIRTMQCFSRVSNQSLYQYAGEPGYWHHVRGNLARNIAETLVREPEWANFNKKDDPSDPFSTIFTADLRIIPHGWARDPMLDLLRDNELRPLTVLDDTLTPNRQEKP